MTNVHNTYNGHKDTKMVFARTCFGTHVLYSTENEWKRSMSDSSGTTFLTENRHIFSLQIEYNIETKIGMKQLFDNSTYMGIR